MKLLSEDTFSRTYLETIKKTPYLIKVSKTGELLNIQEYISEQSAINISQSRRNLEFG